MIVSFIFQQLLPFHHRPVTGPTSFVIMETAYLKSGNVTKRMTVVMEAMKIFVMVRRVICSRDRNMNCYLHIENIYILHS